MKSTRRNFLTTGLAAVGTSALLDSAAAAENMAGKTKAALPLWRPRGYESRPHPFHRATLEVRVAIPAGLSGLLVLRCQPAG